MKEQAPAHGIQQNAARHQRTPMVLDAEGSAPSAAQRQRYAEKVEDAVPREVSIQAASSSRTARSVRPLPSAAPSAGRQPREGRCMV